VPKITFDKIIVHKRRFLSMKNFYLPIFLLAILVLSFSCKKQDITPAFLILLAEDFKDCIDVSDFNSTNPGSITYEAKHLEAIKQQNFRDVLVSLNGTELGYWTLPCTIPLMPNYGGINRIRIIPCVRTPNTTITTLPYYFVKAYSDSLEMTRTTEYTISNIKFKYDPTVDFPLLDIFDGSTEFQARDTFISAITFESIGRYDTELKKEVGTIILSGSDKFFDVESTKAITLHGSGERQFWEISYKTINGQMTTHLSFENSVMGVTNQDMIVLPATQGVWKKVYIDITDIIRQASYTAPTISIRLRITGLRNNSNIGDSEFYFENIKLITMDAPYF